MSDIGDIPDIPDVPEEPDVPQIPPVPQVPPVPPAPEIGAGASTPAKSASAGGAPVPQPSSAAPAPAPTGGPRAPGRYLGFDVASYPGDGVVAWLWGHGFRISGLYLNHRRGGPEDDSWISRRALLVKAGWGLAPLYLGWQTVNPNGSRASPPGDPMAAAATDAAEAARLMAKAGFAAGSAVYCDIEDGTPPSGACDTYLAALFSGIRTAGFLPAAYCSYLCAPWAAKKGVACWSFHIPAHNEGAIDPGNVPAAAIDAGCIGTQFRQNVHLSGLPLAIDLDWFSVADPSRATVAAK
jgi:hypothetical protein